jgi:branched-chain amino acid transport system ATP-binding protein
MLQLRNVETHYGRIRALRGISLEVAEGEIITLIGANGAGKTTTLMSICGVVAPSAGEILFRNRPLQGLRPEEIVAAGIAQVPEGRRIFPNLTVSENLDMGAYLRRDRSAIHKDQEHIFSLFPILSERRHQAGGTLSGGEQQMLAISRALMTRPKLLLLDEPSLGLAPLVVKRIFEVIAQINREDGTTVLLVEQNANLALKLAHRGYVMETGQIVLEDSAKNLLQNEQVKRAYLGL